LFLTRKQKEGKQDKNRNNRFHKVDFKIIQAETQ
jgi:hypothetical protein